jgi:tetratricopeptide (TPR) repeat protein
VYWRYVEALGLVSGGLGSRHAATTGEARGLLKQVARHRPSWPAPLVLEGRIEDAEGNTAEAVRCYKQAVDLGENRSAVLRRLAELLYQSRHYTEANAVLSRISTDSSGRAAKLAAQVSLSAREDPEKTLRLAEAAVARASDDYRDYLWLGQVRARLGKTKAAEEALRKALELGGKQPAPRVALVQFFAANQQREEALALIRQASGKIGPEALAACFEAAGDRKAAAEQYQKILAERPDDLAVLEEMSLFLLRSGNPDQAAVHLRKIIQGPATPPHVAAWARRVLSVALASGGDYRRSTEALALLEKNGRGGKADAEDQRIVALIQARRPGGRREAIRNLEASFLHVPPDDGERFLLAYLYAANREWPRAREQFLRLLADEANPNPSYLAVFIRLLIDEGQTDEAAHWLAELDKVEGKELRAVALHARLLHKRKEGDTAVAALQHFAPADPAQHLEVARLLEELGFAAQAERYYRSFAHARGKETATNFLPLITYLGRRNRVNDALDLCEQQRGKVPDETLVHVWVAVLRSGRPDTRHCQRVEGWIQASLAKQPGTSVFWLALANLRDLQGHTDQAEAIYLDLLRRDEKNLVAHNNLAALLAFRLDQADEALRHIQRALELAGPLPLLLGTRAIVFMTQGQWEKAKNDLEELVSMEPRPDAYLRLARAYFMYGNRQEARAALGKAKAPDGSVQLADLHPLERPAYEELVRDLDEAQR